MIVRDQTPLQTLGRRFAQLRAAAQAADAPPAAQRRSHLATLEGLLQRSVVELANAIDTDFGHRSQHETRLTEIFPILQTARHARRNLAGWMAPQRKPLAAYFRPARARVMWQPLGVVGIVVPWNYPVLLALSPLVGALAAGNRAMLKMSEFTPHTARVLARLLHGEFAADHVRVETGGIDVGRAFAALPFDHLLFTGSTETGRAVLRASAHNLTPVTLELGGKSPAIVGPDAPLARAARRIMDGKVRNAGQTCIAPDYVLVSPDRTDAFVAHARSAVSARFPGWDTNPDYTSIVTDAQFDRLSELLADATAKGATIHPLHAGSPAADRTLRRMPPVAVLDVNDRMRLMHEEIFGPILPIVPYATLDAAIAYVNARPRPLALYYFGERAADAQTVLQRTVSGSVCINDVMLQFAADDLPFGGVGASGFGAYHGRAGFESFSHQKAVFEQSARAGSDLLAPPYGKRFEALLKILSR